MNALFEIITWTGMTAILGSIATLVGYHIVHNNTWTRVLAALTYLASLPTLVFGFAYFVILLQHPSYSPSWGQATYPYLMVSVYATFASGGATQAAYYWTKARPRRARTHHPA
jgi:MFS superfamily sulfate permease-like transporter